MSAVRVLDIGTDVDLALFSAFLWQQDIVHRVFEEQGRQVLEILDPQQATTVREHFAAWQSGALRLEKQDREVPARSLFRLIHRLRRYPALAVVLLMTVACYPATWSLSNGSVSGWLSAFTFVEVTLVNGQLQFGAVADGLLDGEVWRLITPIFLHFSVAHLLFNLAVVAEFGRRLEQGLGSFALVACIGLIAALSNISQYVWSGSELFGGASGVAYGLVGFVVARSRRHADQEEWRVNPSFAFAILVFLVLMSTGVTEVFGLYIANAAHWSGLLVGAALGLAWRDRRSARQQVSQTESTGP